MDVIITGGTSFIGLAVIRKLLEEEHQVWAAVRPDSSNRSKLPADSRLHQVFCSLEEMDRLPERLKEAGFGKENSLGKTPSGKEKPPVFLHMAWDGVGSAGRRDRAIQENNVKNSMKAIQAAEMLSCRRFVFSGSQAEYGIHTDAMSEETPCHPVSEYGKAKLKFMEMASKAWGREDGAMEYVHCRIFSVYGPGDHPWSLVNTCLDTFEKGGNMQLGECTQKWNFLYIDDMADAVLSLLFSEKKVRGIYNIAGKDTRVLREFVEEMYEICGRKGSFTYGARTPNAEGPASLIPDIRKIEAATGWRPVTSFHKGIEITRRSKR